MSSVSGYSIIKTPCCGKLYTTARYSSINTSAKEYWTDGQLVESCALLDGDLRRCGCGQFFLLHQAQNVGMVAESIASELPAGGVDNFKIPEHLRHGSTIPPPVKSGADTTPIEPKLDRYGKPVPPAAIQVPDSALALVLVLGLAEADDVELILRRRYWRLLNDPYRDAYRAHRTAVDSAVKQAKGSNTLWIKLAGKLRNATAPKLLAPAPRAFTVPPYSPTQHQRENMQALLHLLLKSERPDPVEIAEIHRELGNYGEALKAIEEFKEAEHTASRLIRELIAEKINEPMRWL